MENKKWLPSDTRNRLIDLCKDRNISQAQLAGVIGIDRSALSRFLSGKTDSMSHEHVIAIAKYFNVSTDFLLGETDDPGRINYDIGELGLTVKAAECLYAQKYLANTPIIRGIDGDELVGLVLKYYEKLDEKYRRMIPLKMVYIPVVNPEE